MYDKEKTVLLNSSTSAIPSNVCSANINGKHYVGVIHKEELNIICISGSAVEAKQVVCRVGPRNIQASITLMQAAWVHVADQHILVLTTSVGVFIYEWDGSVLLFSHLLPQPSPEDPACFTRGIADLYPGFVYVGMHTGEILVFKIEDSAISLLEKPHWHATAISTLHDHCQKLMSGDEAGNIVVSEQKDGLHKLYMIETYGSPVMSIRNWEQYIIAGYMSGHLRIYSIKDGKIRAEVSAHARCITGLDVAEESGLLLSVAEDSFVRVWKLLENGINPIQHKYSTTLTNVLLCGGVFRDQLGSGFIVTGYDLKEVICYRM